MTINQLRAPADYRMSLSMCARSRVCDGARVRGTVPSGEGRRSMFRHLTEQCSRWTLRTGQHNHGTEFLQSTTHLKVRTSPQRGET